jgi:hypothetical protein
VDARKLMYASAPQKGLLEAMVRRCIFRYGVPLVDSRRARILCLQLMLRAVADLAPFNFTLYVATPEYGLEQLHALLLDERCSEAALLRIVLPTVIYRIGFDECDGCCREIRRD